MRIRIAAALVCLAAGLYGQDADPGVALSGGPAGKAWTVLYFYTPISGSDYLEYTCSALGSRQGTSTIGITQIVDSANVSTVTTSEAHGLSADNAIRITGAAGGAAALNTTHKIVSVGSTTTFTIATSGIADATYNSAGMMLTTGAPRTTNAVWAIKKNYYGGTGGTTFLGSKWAVKSGNRASATSQDNVCDSRATLAYQ